MQHPGKGISWVHPGLLRGRWCPAGLHHFRAADGHGVSFSPVSKGEKPESSFTVGGKERAPSAVMLRWHKVGCRVPGSPPSQFWSNPKAAEHGPVATPLWASHWACGAATLLAVCSVPPGASVCWGVAEDFGYAAPFPWQERSLRQKGKNAGLWVPDAKAMCKMRVLHL